jgi:hypothetical protein
VIVGRGSEPAMLDLYMACSRRAQGGVPNRWAALVLVVQVAVVAGWDCLIHEPRSLAQYGLSVRIRGIVS